MNKDDPSSLEARPQDLQSQIRNHPEPNMKHCSNCGAKLIDSLQKFCGECGASLIGANRLQEESSKEAVQPKKTSTSGNTLLAVVILILFIILIALVCSLAFKSSMTQAPAPMPTKIDSKEPEESRSIKLGDSYASVEKSIDNQFDRDFLRVAKSTNKISVSNRQGTEMNQNSVYEYYFKKKILIQTRLILNVPNPIAMLSFINQQRSANYGDPTTATKNGKSVYLWKINGENSYSFVEYSEWFKTDCVVSVTER